ncbi:hypothetical protein HaLaN_13332 [Haematococcus lacustris]|uniref:Uncharacterized protein n=1 Tax=Haematococcus lacustris TaxID=44745 RepID=A0A699Z5K5_HAELA|nr:hypothetical protein HaLaN_13332 [Haematococcus lacustris]
MSDLTPSLSLPVSQPPCNTSNRLSSAVSSVQPSHLLHCQGHAWKAQRLTWCCLPCCRQLLRPTQPEAAVLARVGGCWKALRSSQQAAEEPGCRQGSQAMRRPSRCSYCSYCCCIPNLVLPRILNMVGMEGVLLHILTYECKGHVTGPHWDEVHASMPLVEEHVSITLHGVHAGTGQQSPPPAAPPLLMQAPCRRCCCWPRWPPALPGP